MSVKPNSWIQLKHRIQYQIGGNHVLESWQASRNERHEEALDGDPVVASTPVSKSNPIQAPLRLGVEVKFIRKKNPVIATSTPTQLEVFSYVSTGFAVFLQLSWCRFGGQSVSFFCKHRPERRDLAMEVEVLHSTVTKFTVRLYRQYRYILRNLQFFSEWIT